MPWSDSQWEGNIKTCKWKTGSSAGMYPILDTFNPLKGGLAVSLQLGSNVGTCRQKTGSPTRVCHIVDTSNSLQWGLEVSLQLGGIVLTLIPCSGCSTRVSHSSTPFNYRKCLLKCLYNREVITTLANGQQKVWKDASYYWHFQYSFQCVQQERALLFTEDSLPAAC